MSSEFDGATVRITMYMMRTRDCRKRDLPKRWALPDRVFFACGACHILAYAFLTRFRMPDARAVWIKPHPGFTGNHILAAFDGLVFDYHGYAPIEIYRAHYWKRAGHWYPGWNGTLVDLPTDVLISEENSRTHDGLWLRQPDQFQRNALPRAERFLDRFAHPAEVLRRRPDAA